MNLTVFLTVVDELRIDIKHHDMTSEPFYTLTLADRGSSLQLFLKPEQLREIGSRALDAIQEDDLVKVIESDELVGDETPTSSTTSYAVGEVAGPKCDNCGRAVVPGWGSYNHDEWVHFDTGLMSDCESHGASSGSGYAKVNGSDRVADYEANAQ